MEYNGAGAVTRSYVHGPGVDEPLVVYEAGQRRFLHADHQGSIVAMNDDAGNPVAINGYDAWGIPNSGNAGRFGYTGQAWIPELGLWYYKARFYSPTTGRFLQVDPVGYDDGMNLYAYVGNDPVNHTDPDGRTCAKNNDGKGVTCKFDDPNGLKGKALDRANRIYTRAVNRLLHNPNRSVTISARNVVSNRLIETKTTAGATAQALIGAHMSYGGKSPVVNGQTFNALTNGNIDSPAGVRITMFQEGLSQSEAGAGRTIVHEGIHGSRDGAALFKASGKFEMWPLGMWQKPPSFNVSHQISHKAAAADLYDNYDD